MNKQLEILGVILTVILLLGFTLIFLDNQIIFKELISKYGYVGIFLVAFLGSATIFFVIPTDIFIFGSAVFLNPLLVGIIGGLGKALGESVGYLIGRGSRKIIDKRYKKEIKKWEKEFKKDRGFYIIILFALTPLPDDLVGIIGGTLKYPFRKFLLASIIGKTILTLILAYAGFYGMSWVLSITSSFT